MRMQKILNRNRAIQVLLLLLLALPLVVAGFYGWQKYQWAQDRMAELEPRYARLLGFESHRAELDLAETRVRAMLTQYAYPGSMEVTQAGNDAQQRVRGIFTQAGLDLVSSQVLPPKLEKQFDRIPLTVRLEGDLVALQSALVVLSGQSPAILVDGFSAQTVGVVKAEMPQRLAIQFDLSVLRMSKQ